MNILIIILSYILGIITAPAVAQGVMAIAGKLKNKMNRNEEEEDEGKGKTEQQNSESGSLHQ